MDIIYSKCYNGVIMVGGFADGGRYSERWKMRWTGGGGGGGGRGK